MYVTMTNEKQNKLIQIYLYVCKKYHDVLQYHCMRMSPNDKPRFTDEEILTIYLFCGSMEQRFTIKSMYTFIKEYYASYFPKLPSYQTFNYRLNRLASAIGILVDELLTDYTPNDYDENIRLVDSFPIILSAGRNRKGKVAPEISSKGYCSTKNMYYFGLKAHVYAAYTKGTIPFPKKIIFTAAGENDGTVFKEQLAPKLYNKVIYGDKIYGDKPFYDEKKRTNNIILRTPCKAVKNEAPRTTQAEKASRDAYSKAVSSVRQPIESFFNWLNEKTTYQRAQKVRSTAGVLIHIWGKIAIAFISLIFNY